MANNVIVSPHYLSSEAGKNIFKLGGNAIDAAIAVNIVQGVVAPETCGIGGDLFALIWKDGEEKPYLNHCIVKDSCNKPDDVDNCKIVSCKTEKKVF